MGCWLAKERSFGSHPTVPNSVHENDGARLMGNSTRWSPHLECPKAAQHLRSWAPSHQKETPSEKSSELNTLEKLKEPRKSITSGGSYQHCNGQKNLHFADDAPQHFQQPDRSLHPTVALHMFDWQWWSTQSTDKASWNHIDRHWQTHALREPSGNQAEVRSPNHMSLYKLCAGCKLGVTWVGHTPPHALLHQL